MRIANYHNSLRGPETRLHHTSVQLRAARQRTGQATAQTVEYHSASFQKPAFSTIKMTRHPDDRFTAWATTNNQDSSGANRTEWDSSPNATRRAAPEGAGKELAKRAPPRRRWRPARPARTWRLPVYLGE